MCAEQAGRPMMRRVSKGSIRPKWGMKNPQRAAPNGNSHAPDGSTLSHGEILGALRALLRGEPSVRLPDHLAGVDGELAGTFNQLAQLHLDLEEQFRVLRQTIGNEGKTRARLHLVGSTGSWARAISSVNDLLDDLTNHIEDIARVVSAVSRGDLTQRIDGPAVDVRSKGDFLKHGRAVNRMVSQLSGFGSEVTRVAREVGIEGKLGAQADVPGVSGVWKELTDGVNSMASNLTSQVREIARVTTAVAQGDLTKTVTIEVRGEVLELKNTINTMVDQLSSFADEVARVAREVGTEGILGGQARVHGVSGVWRELTENVNSMANNLTLQVRNIAEVTTAVAQGDLTRKIAVDARGEILELKNTINTMVDQLSRFADEVTRLASDVGVEGKLGGQADVRGVSGTWRDLTDAVNSMARNLTNQVRSISEVATAIAEGDLEKKIAVDAKGEVLELKNTINTMVDQLSRFAEQVTRVAREVGTEGKLGGQASVEGVRGTWKELTGNVNMMGSNLTNQVRDIARVTTAVATGDLSKKITVEVRGELLELKNTINTMVDQLSSFADEVTRVAREVGTEGILGGQAQVQGVSGTWRELTDNVNIMARNLTGQVRGIARVVTAVARGDLKQELRLDTKGEIETLVDTINDMIVTLSTFADQVSGVARDVGVEGRLGGQADVPSAAGIWRDLTNNVNELAGNLTRQVRAIGDVATAVTKGDLTQTIDVEARGEVAFLKDNINQMIRALAATTKVNEQQDWLKTNLTGFTRMLQGQRDLLTVAEQVLWELVRVVDSQYGTFYLARRDDDGELRLHLAASYAANGTTDQASRDVTIRGMVGQAALDKRRILVTNVPPDYVVVSSSLGRAAPLNLVVVPLLFEGEPKGVIELASFNPFTPVQLAFIDQLTESLGIVVATIEATMRTDELLRQSQGMAEELKKQQEELQNTNEALEEKARQLTAQKDEVEQKNHEVNVAKQELEEKARQLALTSQYKSQFLANMSHELRTPLNSLLILSRQLAENRRGTLDEKQVEYAQTIHQSGTDLLNLINEILDLAKVESGTMAIDPAEVKFADLEQYLQRSFRQIATEKRLYFEVQVADGPITSLVTDDLRLRQVLRNLLSNAMKFTEHGRVSVTIGRAEPHEWSRDIESLNRADAVIAFKVMDSGIGIPDDKQAIIFEAFQQAEGGTSRKYGGTGLGLSISREIALLLGGELRVESATGRGSIFSLFLPRLFTGRTAGARVSGPHPPKRHDALVAVKPGEMPSLRGKRILVVDDDVRNIFALSVLLEEHEMQVLRAETGHEALAQLQANSDVDAVLMDVMMPEMDGFEAMRRIRARPDWKDLPIIALTAKAMKGDREQCMAAGASDYITKPVDPEQLTRVLARWLQT
jgi:signal transduction histidine kinase/HAMP domain-containing protein/ActR/RegA family two-component response regulator